MEMLQHFDLPLTFYFDISCFAFMSVLLLTLSFSAVVMGFVIFGGSVVNKQSLSK